MLPVDQTSFGKPHGNCFSACVASILHLPVEDVPWFMGPEDWWAGFLDWLRPRGLSAISFPLRDGVCGYLDGVHHILSGKSPREQDGELLDHSVVALGEEVVHDPHPSRGGLVTRTDTIILFPLDLGAWRRG